MNDFDYTALHEEAQLTTFLLPSGLRDSFAKGTVHALPLSYTGIADYFASLDFDIAIFHVSAVNAEGNVSFGIAADFGPVIWPRAKKRILLANRSMPFLTGAPQVSADKADIIVETEDPLLDFTDSKTPAAIADITGHISALVPNGATIQTGIGGVPGAMLSALTEKRDLKVHSGVINDGFMALAKSGALARDHIHKTGIAFGSRRFYEFLYDYDALSFAPVTDTHNAKSLAGIEKFTAINSALEVDLFGQANLEWKGSRLVSGVGGAPDFIRGALSSCGGRSIIALPAATGAGVTRIVPKLSAPTISLSRDLADIVVTQNGAAKLRNRSPDERAEALIAIAPPEHRAMLDGAWREMRKSF
ncbi:acetyl-CoA hydrolase/transferase family protein [Marinicaulis aureus]|uniref:Acetyl-CoA hydrolase/transferase family protein n=1 Tax=Hyphococcus aureus TaxID=2666033 RepID=A0ABW1KU80_9PROT